MEGWVGILLLPCVCFSVSNTPPAPWWLWLDTHGLLPWPESHQKRGHDLPQNSQEEKWKDLQLAMIEGGALLHLAQPFASSSWLEPGSKSASSVAARCGCGRLPYLLPAHSCSKIRVSQRPLTRPPFPDSVSYLCPCTSDSQALGHLPSLIQTIEHPKQLNLFFILFNFINTICSRIARAPASFSSPTGPHRQTPMPLHSAEKFTYLPL